jgi:electron transfer flavoprotein beta subunit
MAAKSKPLETRDLAAVGVETGEVGLEGSWTQLVEATPRPPKQAGSKVEDDGSGTAGASALAEFLASKKFI